MRRTLSPQFVRSPEFTIAYVSGLIFLGLGLPLLIECGRHFVDGRFVAGCMIGTGAVTVSGLCLWKLKTSLSRARRKYRWEAPPSAAMGEKLGP